MDGTATRLSEILLRGREHQRVRNKDATSFRPRDWVNPNI